MKLVALSACLLLAPVALAAGPLYAVAFGACWSFYFIASAVMNRDEDDDDDDE